MAKGPLLSFIFVTILNTKIAYCYHFPELYLVCDLMNEALSFAFQFGVHKLCPSYKDNKAKSTKIVVIVTEILI